MPKGAGIAARIPKCPMCGYSWKGLPDKGQCPECGVAFDEESRIWRGGRLGRTIVTLVLIAFIIAVVRSIILFLNDLISGQNGSRPDWSMISMIFLFGVMFYYAWPFVRRCRCIIAYGDDLYLNATEDWKAKRVPWKSIGKCEIDLADKRKRPKVYLLVGPDLVVISGVFRNYDEAVEFKRVVDKEKARAVKTSND